MNSLKYLRRASLDRRGFCLGGAAALGTVAAAKMARAVDLQHTSIDDLHELQYDVMWHEKPIGSHRIALKKSGEDLVIEHNSSIEVSILFVSALSLRQEIQETWRGGQLLRIASSTVRNDKQSSLEGELQNGEFVIRHDGETLRSGPDVATLDSLWLLSSIQHNNLLDTKSGRFVAWNKRALGERTFEVGGATRRLAGYHIDAGETHADLWYDGDFLAVSDLEEEGQTAHIELTSFG